MKRLFILLLCFPVWCGAQVLQVSGTVVDKETKAPLPFVNITINQSKYGTAADLDGHFSFESEQHVHTLTFSFVGYKKLIMPITDKGLNLVIELEEELNELQEVELLAGENPAFRIIRNATSRRKENDPERLENFTYSSYNKFVVSLDAYEELQVYDTVAVEGSDSMMVELDSTNWKLQRFMDKQHLFMVESVSDRMYNRNPRRNNEKIVAARASGLKSPTFILLATQFQSFSFYNDYISLLDNDYLNPISKGSTKKYQFFLRDTVLGSADTTYIISFQPKANPAFDALEGSLAITTDGWALKHIVAQPHIKEDFGVSIQQKSEKFGEQWFPVQMNYDFNIPDFAEDLDVPIDLVGVGRTYIKDVKLQQELDKKEFSRIEIKVEDEANTRSTDYWDAHRELPLDTREQNTYRVLDSLGEVHHFDRRMRWIQALVEGKLRVGFFDFELDKVFNFSIYEGFRLGVGGRTNQKVSKWFTLGGYVAYGFKDQVVKYGYDVDFIFQKERNIGLKLGYSFDIEETGGQSFSTVRKKNVFTESNYREVNLQQFDEVSNIFAEFHFDVYPNLQARIFANRQNRFTTEFGYYYIEPTNDGFYKVNGFNAFQTGASITYAPGDKYMEGPFGRRAIKKTYPVYQLQYTKAIPVEEFETTITYDKIDLRMQFQFKTRLAGLTFFELGGGYVWGDVPFSFLYSSRTNRPTNVDWPVQPADPRSFETMFNNEFLSSSFVHFMFRQNFKARFLHIKDWKPDFEVVFRASYGELSNPERHGGLTFNTLENGYYETGAELNKIFQGLGVGFYYRFGPYSLIDPAQNWSIKLSLRPNFF